MILLSVEHVKLMLALSMLSNVWSSAVVKRHIKCFQVNLQVMLPSISILPFALVNLSAQEVLHGSPCSAQSNERHSRMLNNFFVSLGVVRL